MIKSLKRRRNGFTLVELLVVIGIIAILIAIIMPSLRKAKQQANAIKCRANLKQIFNYMVEYSNANRGYMFPAGPDTSSGSPQTFGTNVMPHQRWPVILLQVKVPNPLAYPDDLGLYSSKQSAASSGTAADMEAHLKEYDSTPYNPKIMYCPADLNPMDNHSYVVNHELVQQANPVRYSNGDRAGKSPSEIIVAGEKRSTVRDYYMEGLRHTTETDQANQITGQVYPTEFDRVVEPYRHGISYGSNYLFLDGHVDSKLPNQAKDAADPWAVAKQHVEENPTP